MLPSPTWPKAIGRIPGNRLQTAPPARVMNSATLLTGTATVGRSPHFETLPVGEWRGIEHQ
jgi:hypothetical protein